MIVVILLSQIDFIDGNRLIIEIEFMDGNSSIVKNGLYFSVFQTNAKIGDSKIHPGDKSIPKT